MEIQLKIEGMSCGHCVMAVEKKLNRLDLIKKTITIGSAKIEFDPVKVSEEDIIKAINETGYSVLS
jgi:copper chaperone